MEGNGTVNESKGTTASEYNTESALEDLPDIYRRENIRELIEDSDCEYEFDYLVEMEKTKDPQYLKHLAFFALGMAVQVLMFKKEKLMLTKELLVKASQNSKDELLYWMRKRMRDLNLFQNPSFNVNHPFRVEE